MKKIIVKYLICLVGTLISMGLISQGVAWVLSGSLPVFVAFPLLMILGVIGMVAIAALAVLVILPLLVLLG